MLSRNNTRPLLRRILDPSAKTLFAISLITFCAAVYLAIPNMPFLLKGSFGEAEIGKKLATTSEYTVYQAKLQLSRMDAKQGKITSDRSNLKMGDIIPVFYRRDEHSKMLAIELFAPWVRSLWLLAASFSALGLALRERDKEAAAAEN
ncbi:MAG: hypothetical protein VYA19_02565 [Pseudomonadota bacterium]|jgi:hypothetical protein|nr:hypothetical protein [Pseudomonadota bacterium]MEC7441616.1 hypothetical protein [Pseudomonadota bacterium]MEC7661169.1 hypothetical protein [Pseudomonadota bacterium]|tara:strand:+ start:1337 stop:1780 length:444 start_codon:yes stop_codon:yes gene_type:complete